VNSGVYFVKVKSNKNCDIVKVVVR
jgi:hypothetical protein